MIPENYCLLPLPKLIQVTFLSFLPTKSFNFSLDPISVSLLRDERRDEVQKGYKRKQG
jgi:hypothetical protein